MRRGKLSESEQCFTKSLSLVANDAKTYWLRAEVRTKLEDLTGAESDRAIARQLDPALGFAKSSVGESLLQTGGAGEVDLAPIERLQNR
jgi:hypothetical protein